VIGAPNFAAVVHPGEVLAGKYRVERVLGSGGIGVVVAALHMQLDERVALKFLLPDALLSAESVARFVREARAAVRIKNEHVARVNDVGELENGSPYIVMEYLEGGDLAAWLRQRGPMPIEQAVDFLLQACEAIAEAHSLGIVHRDLKPANLFCIQKPDGSLFIKVLDFGISKVARPDASGNDMTRTTALMGSPFYMSPEHMQLSKGVDVRTDIWSLGIILFELLTGRPPFYAEAVTELAIQVAMEPAPPLRAFRSDAPAGLEQVIATCLQKDRAMRFQNVGELALALKDFGSKRSRLSVEGILGTLRMAGLSEMELPPSVEPQGMAPRPGASSGTPFGAGPTTASWGQTGPNTSGNKTALIGGVIAVGITLLVVGGVLVSRGLAARSTATHNPVSDMDTTPSQPAPFVPPEESAMAPSVAVTDLPSVPPAPSASVPQSPPAAGTPHPAAVGPAQPVRPVAPRPNCNPPYDVDSLGQKKWKRQCL
jgi:eukaryotic-like serine/threonine-protein kinase